MKLKELEELREAIEADDLVKVLDAFCDLQYVLSHGILSFGLGKLFSEAFEEVQRSNMSKACENKQVAQETIEYRLEKKGEKAYMEFDKVSGKYLVKREEDGKIMKSINYSPADLQKFINEESKV